MALTDTQNNGRRTRQRPISVSRGDSIFSLCLNGKLPPHGPRWYPPASKMEGGKGSYAPVVKGVPWTVTYPFCLSHWPELGHVAVPGCKGVWESSLCAFTSPPLFEG